MKKKTLSEIKDALPKRYKENYYLSIVIKYLVFLWMVGALSYSKITNHLQEYFDLIKDSNIHFNTFL